MSSETINCEIGEKPAGPGARCDAALERSMGKSDELVFCGAGMDFLTLVASTFMIAPVKIPPGFCSGGRPPIPSSLRSDGSPLNYPGH